MRQKTISTRKIVCILVCVLMVISFTTPIFAGERDAHKEVVLGGCFFGVKLYTDGVPVVGVESFETEKGKSSPAYEAGIKVKDIIVDLNGIRVNTAAQITSVIRSSEGKPISVVVIRDGSKKTFEIKPKKGKDGIYRAGMWLRDNAAGIGTVTYIDPDTLEFAGLGHGICDAETMSLMPMLRGSVSEVELNSVIKGKSGVPGELKGSFKGGKTGALISNKITGVYGVFTTLPNGVGERIATAKENEVHEGNALIRCAVSGKLRDYTVRISKVNCHTGIGKNFVIEVTDPELISITGGIVQGMSGSPVIQDGKLIGAVTHVMISSPTKGYGIFIENMLNNA